MIKVLAHGNQHLQAVCPKCGCFFQYETEDIETIQKYTPGSRTAYLDLNWKIVKCPECGFDIQVGGNA